MALDLKQPPFFKGDHFADNVYMILYAYLDDPAKTASTTANTITELCAPFTQSGRSFEENLKVRHVWVILFWLIKQISHQSPLQDRLIHLVSEIRNIPPTGEPCQVEQQLIECRFWKDLPLIRNVWTSYEFEAPLHPPMATRSERAAESSRKTAFNGAWRGHPLTGWEWANLHAFMARLHAVTDLIYMDIRGLCAMLDALEDNVTPEAANDLVPAAAVWITYAGEKLKSNNVGYPSYETDSPDKRLPWSCGDLYKGYNGGFSAERWSFWKERFRIIAEMDGVSDNVKSMSREAFERMTVLDGA